MATKALSSQAASSPSAAPLGEGDGCSGLFAARVGQSCLGQCWVPLLSWKAGARADGPLAHKVSWCPQGCCSPAPCGVEDGAVATSTGMGSCSW